MNLRSPLRLVDYYLIEAMASMGATLFLYSVFFWAHGRYGYTSAQNLLLGSCQGLAYVLGSRYGGRLADRLGYGRLLAACLSFTALLLLVGWRVEWSGMPFVVLSLFALWIGPVWPSLEAGILHAPSRLSTPQRLGLYNITWSFAGAVGLFLGSPIFAWQPDAVLWIPACLEGAALAWLWAGLRRAPAPDSLPPPNAHRGDALPKRVKQRFMHIAWLANASSYFYQAGLTALLPFLAAGLGLTPAAGIALSSSLLFARALAFVGFSAWERWHYREWANLVSCLAMPASLAVIFFGSSVPVVLAGFLCMGVTVGLAYYMSIYYTLDFGDEKGKHGGLHESVLGLGMWFGPLVGAVAAHFGGGAVVAQVWLVALGALLCIGGYAALSRKALR